MKYSLSESKEHLQPFAGIRIVENVFLLEINEKPGLIANTKLCFSSSFMANSLFICFQ